MGHLGEHLVGVAGEAEATPAGDEEAEGLLGEHDAVAAEVAEEAGGEEEGASAAEEVGEESADGAVVRELRAVVGEP